MNTCLITGASGFIGKALQTELENRGHRVLTLTSEDGDISEKETWENIPYADWVFHLAGKNFVPDSWKSPESFLKTNLLGTQNALDYCNQHRAKLIFASAYLYGAPESMPIDESADIKPNNPYALSKYLCEQLCTFNRQYEKTNVTSLRLFNVYGPGQRRDYLIPTILCQIKNKQSISVENLIPKRDYIYIDDVISAMVVIAAEELSDPVFNVGSGESYSVAEIIRIIQEAAGTNFPVNSENVVRKNEIPEVRADVSLLSGKTGWLPQTTFKSGIEKIILQENI